MDSVDEFLEKEIDGKPFYIFTLSSPSSSSSGEAAIDLCGDNELSLHQQPRFICPNLRRKAEMQKRKEDGYSSDDSNDYPFTISPHLIESNNQMITITHEDICKHTLLPLFWCNNQKFNDRSCGACLNDTIGTDYYKCVGCDWIFHKECVESPLSIKHPSYPFLSFQLYNIQFLSKCIICDELLRRMTYYCPTLKIAMHTFCALKPIPIVINHFKRHSHPLTFFPRQASLVCNVCGIIKELIPTYVCARCDFVAHQDCIYFPYVIRISRHQHRISFTYSLPSGNWSCGVCRKKIDNNYGAYSCNTCDGGYFVHTRCALRRDLWDGEELEGVPQEPEIVVEPFKTIADGIILHFSHPHHNLQLFTTGRIYDENMYCQACVLPIYQGAYYSCVSSHCDYILHETCANAPLKKHNPLHAHSLTLKAVTNEYTCVSFLEEKKGHFDCYACERDSCGFVYETTSKYTNFRLDLRCASVSEPFKYEGHEHPLFLALSREEERTAKCQICQDDRQYRGLRKLNCIECNYVICFRCATLPFEARYKHDKHFLTFKKEVVDGSDWCEACEKKIVYSKKGGFYACDEYCCTTLHVDCLLGKDPYMKPGQAIQYYREFATIHRNNTLTRPLCSYCNKRCQHKVVFKWEERTFCSLLCMSSF